MITLSSLYLGPILHYALLAQQESYQVDFHEHFVKQSYRSRCEIYAANGKLKLIVPLQKWAHQSPIKSIKISYQEDWQKLHWRSFESAYRLSPFFEFYEEDLKPFYEKKYAYLVDFNLELEGKIKTLLNIENPVQITEKYEVKQPDYRQLIHPKNNAFAKNVKFEKYMQVFGEKHGFIENLSILDLLFNLGPTAKDYLNQTTLTD